MIPFPSKKFDIIYADPPWRYADTLHAKGMRNQSAESHYNTMSLADIKALPVQDIAADNCVLFLWVTMPLLPEGLEVIKAWGFKYKSNAFTWIKTNKKARNSLYYGLGRWTRGNAELCLIAVKGKPKRVGKDVFSVVLAPIREHSRKPDEVRDLIRRLVGNGDAIELFSRQRAIGWEVWGNQAPQEPKRTLLD